MMRCHPVVLCLVLIVIAVQRNTAQNAEEDDQNTDWIPITPSLKPASPSQASGRVLNLEAPVQQYYENPEDYPLLHKRRPTLYVPQLPKPGPTQLFRQQHQQQPFYLTPELIAPVHPSPQYYIPHKPQPAPSPPQYHRPINTTLINPNFINREILGAIQNHHNIPHMEKFPLQHQSRLPERETVQLLYVPLESLNKAIQPKPSPLRTQSIYSQPQPYRLPQLIPPATTISTTTTTTTTTTTQKPKKRKPHQPPLAVFMNSQDNTAQVSEVLHILKHSSSIAVQDSVGPNSPQIFVGPSDLNPEGYTKFPLPYLSNINGNRIERKVDHLPFFVAPVHYKAPPGYSKILLPSPHIGSVVVSNKEELVPPKASQNLLPDQQPFRQYTTFSAQDARQAPLSPPPPSKITSIRIPPTTEPSSSVYSYITQSTHKPTFLESHTEHPQSKYNVYVTPTNSQLTPHRQTPAINNYELQQINQFGNSAAPAVALSSPSNLRPTSYNYNREEEINDEDEEEIHTTSPPHRYRLRQRTKPTRPPPTVTATEPGRYTVLEDFSVKSERHPTFPTTTTTPITPYTTSSTTTTTTTTTSPESEYSVEPAKVYKLPVITKHREHFLNQDLMDQQILRQNYAQQQQQQHQSHHFLPSLINDLQSEHETEPLPTIRTLSTSGRLLPSTTQKTAAIDLVVRRPAETTTDAPSYYETTTTPFKRTRTRQRITSTTNTASRTSAISESGHTTNSGTRRTPPPRRRLPASRTRPTTTSTTEIPSNQYDTTTHRRSSIAVQPTRQRFRTRGRPATVSSANERVYQTLTSSSEETIRASTDPFTTQAHSFMKFEHTIDPQQVITLRPGQKQPTHEYQRTDSYPESVQEPQQMVDVLINHNSPQVTPALVTKNHENGEDEYVRFVGGQVSTDQTTRTTPIRIRTKVRTRFRPTQAQQPPTTTTTTTARTTSTESSEPSEEYYGFIRQPNFEQVKNINDAVDTTATTTTVPPPRQRTRLHIHNTTPKTEITSRGRGRAHFRLPTKHTDSNSREEEEDEELNYPRAFLQTSTTRRPVSHPSFQITLDPYEEDEREEDQQPRASILSTQIIPNPNLDWEGPSEHPKGRGVWKLVGVRSADPLESAESQHYQSVLNEIFKENITSTPTTTTTTTAAASGLFDSILHIFDDEQSTAGNPTTTTLAMPVDFPQEITETTAATSTTTTSTTSIPEIQTEHDSDILVDEPEDNKGEYESDFGTVVPEFTTELPDSPLRAYEVEPWDMRLVADVKTSTSTEISHATEICYRGKCVKANTKNMSIVPSQSP